MRRAHLINQRVDTAASFLEDGRHLSIDHGYQQAISLLNWPFAATISIVFTVSIVGIMYIFNRMSQAHTVEARG